MSPNRTNPSNEPDGKTHDCRNLTEAHWKEFSELSTGKLEEIFTTLYASTSIHKLGPALHAAASIVPQVIGDFCEKHKLCYGCIGPVLTALAYRQMFNGLGASIDEALQIQFIHTDVKKLDLKTLVVKPTKKEMSDDDRN